MNVLKSITTFAALPVGVPTSLPHGLQDALGAGLVPDHIEDDHPDVVVIGADDTNVTVRNDGAAPVTVSVLCEHWHSENRALPPGQTDLPVQPFVPSSGGVSNPNNVTAAAVIGNNKIVTGDGGARGVKGTLPEVDGSGNIVPPADGTLNVGTAAAKFQAVQSRRLFANNNNPLAPSTVDITSSVGTLSAQVAATGYEAQQTARASGAGSAAFGYVFRAPGVPGVGTSQLLAGSASPGPGFAFGAVIGYGAYNAEINASGDGAVALGRAYGATANAQILASGIAAFAHGFSNSGFSASASLIRAANRGGFAQGFAYNASIDSGSNGSFAQGYVYEGTILSSQSGALAQGYAYNASDIQATNEGALARGHALDGSTIRATGLGAHAMGYANDAAIIEATGKGCTAMGAGNLAGSYLRAANAGAFAHGYAVAGYTLEANGVGNFALGATQSQDVRATGGSNCGQLGEGTNTLADSTQFGAAGLRMKHSVGAPGIPQNGDMWIAGGNVYVQSGGVARNITNVP